MKLDQYEQLKRLNSIAIRQMRMLTVGSVRQLEGKGSEK